MEKNKHVRVGITVHSNDFSNLTIKVTKIMSDHSFAGVTLTSDDEDYPVGEKYDDWSLTYKGWTPVHGYNTPLWKVLNGEEVE